MAFERDIYYEALVERLRERVPGVVMWSRRGLLASQIPASMQPAAVLRVASQAPEMEHGVPTMWTLGADLHLLVTSRGQSDVLDTVLNGLVDQVEAALLLDPGERSGDRIHTSLGGKVEHVRIAGPVEFMQGDGGDQAEVIIPLDMLVMGGVSVGS